MSRYVVIITRSEFDVEDLTTSVEVGTVGPFRTLERAEHRAAVICRRAETYEDPEGVTGPDNALSVHVERLEPGSASAQRVLDLMYGSVVV